MWLGKELHASLVGKFWLWLVVMLVAVIMWCSCMQIMSAAVWLSVSLVKLPHEVMLAVPNGVVFGLVVRKIAA